MKGVYRFRHHITICLAEKNTPQSTRAAQECVYSRDRGRDSAERRDNQSPVQRWWDQRLLQQSFLYNHILWSSNKESPNYIFTASVIRGVKNSFKNPNLPLQGMLRKKFWDFYTYTDQKRRLIFTTKSKVLALEFNNDNNWLNRFLQQWKRTITTFILRKLHRKAFI